MFYHHNQQVLGFEYAGSSLDVLSWGKWGNRALYIKGTVGLKTVIEADL